MSKTRVVYEFKDFELKIQWKILRIIWIQTIGLQEIGNCSYLDLQKQLKLNQPTARRSLDPHVIEYFNLFLVDNNLEFLAQQTNIMYNST